MRRLQLITWPLLLLLALLACGDDDHFACTNGACSCATGERCAIPCAAPPCHLECAGDNERCVGECANGSCTCGPNSLCDFECQSPPCHATCEPGSTCRGECENGSCTCASGATCEFECGSGPCQVACAGDNPLCAGECQNGGCNCGRNSECRFTCLDHGCQVTCAPGSRCMLDCPQGRAGQPGCDFTICASGPKTVCPDGHTVTCGMACPAADAGAGR